MNRSASLPAPSGADSARAWQLCTAAAAGALGALAALAVRLLQGSSPSADRTLTAPLVAATMGGAGAFSWWLLVARRREATPQRGAGAGALAALLGYLLVFQAANLAYGAAGPELFGRSLGARIAGGALLSFEALASSGWLVVPLLALAGAGLAALQAATGLRLAYGLVARSRALLPGRPLLRALLSGLGAVVALAVALGAWVWTRPLRVGDLKHTATPAADYAASVAAIRAAIAAEAADPALNPVCQSRLLEQGRRARRAVVFFHGFTNCPAQFEPLARQLAERGYSVYVPLLPRHGRADRLTDALAELSAEELAQFADRSVDLARGLADELMVVGLSGGGNMAAWVAQQRADVAQVALVAPLFQIQALPAFAIRPLASTILAAPNFYLWWDGEKRERVPGPAYAYPRYPVHAIGSMLRLSFAVQDAAGRAPPAVRDILVVTNAADEAVSGAATNEIADLWARQGATVRRYVFPAELRLHHDMIDVSQVTQRVDLVYPKLIELLEARP